MFWFAFDLLCDLFIIFCILASHMFAIRNRKYQKLWDKEKLMRIRLNPKISRAELCEFYVMFCKRNNCNVEFKE